MHNSGASCREIAELYLKLEHRHCEELTVRNDGLEMLRLGCLKK